MVNNWSKSGRKRITIDPDAALGGGSEIHHHCSRGSNRDLLSPRRRRDPLFPHKHCDELYPLASVVEDATSDSA